MSKMTLLELTQDILSDMESDDVNSINDTVEALQVAQILKSTYFNITDGKDWPFLFELFKLNASGDTAKPNYMSIPDTIMDVKWVKYNTIELGGTRDKYTEIRYKTPEDFVNFVNFRDSSSSTITSVTDFSGIPLSIYNERPPVFFTSFDDNYLVFDAYDSGVDTTLQNSKSQAYGRRNITFTIDDDYTPDLPVQMFSYLLNEAKSTCFLILKQMSNQKAEQHSISQRRRMSQQANKLVKGITYPNYGRK